MFLWVWTQVFSSNMNTFSKKISSVTRCEASHFLFSPNITHTNASSEPLPPLRVYLKLRTASCKLANGILVKHRNGLILSTLIKTFIRASWKSPLRGADEPQTATRPQQTKADPPGIAAQIMIIPDSLRRLIMSSDAEERHYFVSALLSDFWFVFGRACRNPSHTHCRTCINSPPPLLQHPGIAMRCPKWRIFGVAVSAKERPCDVGNNAYSRASIIRKTRRWVLDLGEVTKRKFVVLRGKYF